MPKIGGCSEIGLVRPMERPVYLELREQESDIGERLEILCLFLKICLHLIHKSCNHGIALHFK